MIYYNDEALINDFAVRELDHFIEATGEKLGISAERMNLLQKEKINYYLTSEEMVEKLTGFKTQGMSNLQFDAVITQNLPHYHELTHLLMNFALGELPLYTLPFLQEGIAVSLGGRWGKAPEVLMQMGWFILEKRFFALEDILSYQEFHQTVASPEISYPLSGIFTQFLIEKMGIEQFEKLYLNLSGTSEGLGNFSAEQVRKQIEKYMNSDWQNICNNFEKYRSNFKYSGILPGSGKIQLITAPEIVSDHFEVYIEDIKVVYCFEIRCLTENTKGAMLLTPKKTEANSNYQSTLFAEQFPQDDYDKEAYGIIFTPEEVGLYDYRINLLLAKYVQSFNPCDDYWNEKEKMIKFSLEKNKIKGNILDYDIELK
jgi:hypothetical protein